MTEKCEFPALAGGQRLKGQNCGIGSVASATVYGHEVLAELFLGMSPWVSGSASLGLLCKTGVGRHQRTILNHG